MNERIRLHAQEAGFKVDWQHEDVQAIKMARFEKFAELIVRECAEIADQPTSQPFRSYGEKIKEHFGVER